MTEQPRSTTRQRLHEAMERLSSALSRSSTSWSQLRGDSSALPVSKMDNVDLPALHAFVHGLRMDLPAVVAGLTVSHSNGPIEGANTKVKLLRRQMYGRAEFPFLRQRILLA
ncbi:transposase [Micromonospora sp. CPCC 206061]|uniref:transposase n=1 Tax=Micromonospora sp. CPCC 206061 TaxID=3122410 RepID=UPI002FF16360